MLSFYCFLVLLSLLWDSFGVWLSLHGRLKVNLANTGSRAGITLTITLTITLALT
jgi:hypothetical protein